MASVGQAFVTAFGSTVNDEVLPAPRDKPLPRRTTDGRRAGRRPAVMGATNEPRKRAHGRRNQRDEGRADGREEPEPQAAQQPMRR